MKNSKILYSIDTEDVQQVAEELLDRKLTSIELELIDSELGEYIDWYGAISNCISAKIMDSLENE